MESGQSYHIYNHANGKENLFLNEENYRFFLQQYAKHLGEVVDTYAYCLMPNHFHLLVGVRSDLPQSQDLSGFKNLEGLSSIEDLPGAADFPVAQDLPGFKNLEGLPSIEDLPSPADLPASQRPLDFKNLEGLTTTTDLPGFKNLEGLRSENQEGTGQPRNPVSQAFSNFFNSYTKAVNKRYGRMGSLFSKNFKRNPILDQDQWQENFLYIHLNPVKHRFTKSHQDWKWSSWHAYEHPTKPSGLERAYYLNFFDGWAHAGQVMEAKRDILLNRDFET